MHIICISNRKYISYIENAIHYFIHIRMHKHPSMCMCVCVTYVCIIHVYHFICLHIERKPGISDVADMIKDKIKY